MPNQGITKTSLVLGLVLVLIAGIFFGYFFHSLQAPSPKESLPTTEKKEQSKILAELSQVVEQLETEGKYACCIEPPCLSCFVDGGLHSRNGKICACDEILEEGGIVCQECAKGLAEGKRAKH